MAIISVIITESEEQILEGIPKIISISTNIASTIFYTLDGIDPTIFSDIYTSPIYLPTDKLSLTLKVLATNGVLYSPIIEELYITNILDNTRLPHSITDTQTGTNISNLYPFGTNQNQPLGHYLNPGDGSVTVDNPNLQQLPTGYNGDGYTSGFTNEPYNLENYSIKYSTTDAEGQVKPGVGTLPAYVKIQNPIPAPEESDQFSKLFDPRASVIFQDFTKENSKEPTCINKAFFSLGDPERISDGCLYFNSGLDSAPVMGSFLRPHYNPTNNTMTYYYLDTHVNKWIISKTIHNPSGDFDGNLSGIRSSRNKGAGIVIEWIPFMRHVLF